MRKIIIVIISLLFFLKPGLSPGEPQGSDEVSAPFDRMEVVTSTLDKLGSLEKTQEGQAVAQLIQESTVLEQKNEIPGPMKITLNFNDVPLSEVINTIAGISDLNIVGGEGLSGKVTIYLTDVSVYEALDSILRTAGYAYVQEGKILRLIPLKEGYLETKIFQLKFISAEQLQEAISRLISERGMIKSFSKFSGEKYTDTLIIKDEPEFIKNISEVISKLDKKVRQVTIAAQFVEVTIDKSNKLGIDWAIAGSFAGGSGPTTFPFGTKGQRLLEPPKLTGVKAEELTDTITVGTISFTDFTVAMEALNTKTKVEIVSNPRIATREGEEAEIIVGDKVPIPLYERMAQTGNMEVSGYQEENVGVVLRVTPIINEDNSITLRVHPEVSEITGYTGPDNERPVISTRQVTTALTIKDGQTMVLGGLRSKTLTKTDKKVPFLGDIPFLGRAFSYKSDVRESTELLIFLTPRVISQ